MRKIIPAVAAGAAVLVVAGGGFGYVTLDKDVSMSVDGVGSDVSTMASTVGEVLQSKGIELGEHDVVVPAVDTKLSDGTQIAVRYGRQVRITIDGQQQTFWTTATRVDQALTALEIAAPGAQLSTSRSTPIGREGLSFSMATEKRITIDDAGRKKQVTTTAQTVGAALEDAKITLDGDDQLSLSEDTTLRNGLSFTVTKIDVSTVTKKERVQPKITYTDSDRLAKGKTALKTKGKPGVKEIKIREVRRNGRLQSRQQTAIVTTPPQDEVVVRGTKEPEPAAPQDTTSDDDASGDPGNAPGAGDGADDGTGTAGNDSADARSGPDGDPGNAADEDADADSDGSDRGDTAARARTADSVWDRLAECESGQRWDTDTGNDYYGGLQFTAQTWRAYGGTDFAALASEASREQQITIAKKVRDDVGWKAWPACSRKLGLS